jgi:hypothetical protein
LGGGGGVTVKDVEIVAEDRREFRCVALEGFYRGLQHVRLRHVFPSDVIAVRVGQMADELALRPAAAFAEGMKGVQFAEIMRGAITAEPIF